MEIIQLNKSSINKEFLEWYKLNFQNEKIKIFRQINFSFLAQNNDDILFIPLLISIKLNKDFLPILFNFDPFNQIILSEKEEKQISYFYSFFIEFLDKKNFIDELKKLLKNIFKITNKENFLLIFFLIKKIIFILRNFFEDIEKKKSENNIYLLELKKLILENDIEEELKIFLLKEFIYNFFNLNFLKENKIDFYSTIFFDDIQTFIYLTNLNLKAKDLKKFLLYFEDDKFACYLGKIINFCKDLNYNKNYFNNVLSIIFEIYKQYKENKFYFEILEKLINLNSFSKNNKSKNEILEIISGFYDFLFSQNKPLNQKQNEFLEFLYILKNPYYKLKENEINEFIKNKGIKNIKFNFSQYFEEKEFEINFKFKNKEDILKFEKEIKIFLSNYNQIWEKL